MSALEGAESPRTPAAASVWSVVGGDRGPFILYCAVLVWAPLPLGSNRAWAWYLLAALALGCLGWWILLAARDGGGRLLRPHRALILLWLAWVMYPMVQIVPLPGAVLELLSPAAYNIHAYGRGVPTVSWGSLSVSPGTTIGEFLKYSGYFALLLLTIALVKDRARVKTVLSLLLAVGAAEAAVGLAARFMGLDLFAWDPTASGTETITVRGTFVNRNHFAAMLVMCGAAGLGLIMSRMGAPRRVKGLRQRVLALVERLLDWGQQRLVLIALIFAGLFFSASRGASLGLIVGFSAAVGLSLMFRGRRTPEIRFVPAVAVAVVLAVVWLGAAPLAERALSTDLRADERLVQWELSLAPAKDYLLFGAGAGNYAEIFPLYRDGTLRPLTYDRAHSDWLEHLIDHGIVGTALLLAALAATYRSILLAYRRRRDLLARGVLFASLVGTFAMVVHGALDFVFQIPATAAYFFVLLGIGLVGSNLAHESRSASKRRDTSADSSLSAPSEPGFGWRGASAPVQDVPLDDL